MKSVIINNRVVEEKVRYEKESATKRFQQELCELQNQVKNFNEQLTCTKEMFQETEEEIKRLQSRANRRCEMIKMESTKERMVLWRLAELEEMTSKKLNDNHDATPSEDESMPEATRNAARYSAAHRIARYVKIGCVMFLDSVAAYALFKITRPLFF